jgi:mannitol-specific phosphotransferase system IIBC component
VKEFAVYTAARLGIFLLSYALVIGVYLLVSGEREEIPLIWPFLVAVVISAVASVYLLRAQRERFALAIHERAQRASARVEQARAKEDEQDEQARAEQARLEQEQEQEQARAEQAPAAPKEDEPDR